jgi:UV DNA damage repair endonuclease
MHADQNLHKKKLEEIERLYRVRTTTLRWLNAQTQIVAEQRLWDMLQHNIQAFYHLVSYVATLPDELRMVRLGSDVLPLYTEPTWSRFWRQQDVQDYCAALFSKVGDFAREKNVRLSMHPGQFTVLASARDEVVKKSIEEFEYHVDVARWMGYGKQFQDFKINVHISGKRGPQGIRDVLPQLSPEARNCLTIENDEVSWGIEASLELATSCALVLDIHHHWVATGEYIFPEDDRFKRIMDSWRGVRPVIHYSVSRHSLLCDQDPEKLPDFNLLLAQGIKRVQLRAHSDYVWNRACNRWALAFADFADIMVESKAKNLASIQLYQQWKEEKK